MYNRISNPYHLTVLVLVLFTFCTNVLGQYKIILNPDGRLIDINRTPKIEESVFYIHAGDPTYSYFINFQKSSESYSNSIYNEGKLQFFAPEQTDKTILKTLVKEKENLTYQIYRFSMKSLPEKDRKDISTVNQLKTKIEQSGIEALASLRENLTAYVSSLTYPEAQEIFKLWEVHQKYEKLIKEKEQQIKTIQASKDSLTFAEYDRYKIHLIKQLTLRTSLNNLLSVLEGASKFRNSNNQQLIDLIENTRTALIEEVDSVNKYEVAKRFHKSVKLSLIQKEIRDILEQKITLEKNSIFEEFLKKYTEVNKSITTKLELIHAGKTIVDNNVEWIDYDIHLNDKNEIEGMSRIAGKLPVLDEFHFLGVQVVNIPPASANETLPVGLTIDLVSNVFPVDRFGSVRTEVGESTGLTDIFKGFKEGNLQDIPIFTDFFMMKSWTLEEDKICDLKDVMLRVLFDLTMTCKKFTNNGVAESVDAIADVLRTYLSLLQTIKDSGKIAAEITHDQAFTDYQVLHGTRFNYGTAPTITFKKNAPKSEDQKTLLLDKLEPIQKTYRFGIATGIIVTAIHDFSYRRQSIGASNQEEVVMRDFMNYSIQPVVFLSMYFKGQRLDLKPTIANSLSLNLGISYVKPLENIYLGVGFEPVRHLQINGGVRFGEVQKIDNDQFNKYNLSFEDSLEDHWSIGYYLGLNFYIKAVSEFVRTVFTKK